MDALTHTSITEFLSIYMHINGSAGCKFYFERNYLDFREPKDRPECLAYVRHHCVSVFDVCEKCFNFIHLCDNISETYAVSMQRSMPNGMTTRWKEEEKKKKNGEKPTKTYKITAIVNAYEIKIPTQYTFASLLPFFPRRFFFLLIFFSYFHHRCRCSVPKFSWSYSVCGACASACAWCVRMYSLFYVFFFLLHLPGKASVNDYMAARVKRKYLLQMFTSHRCKCES